MRCRPAQVDDADAIAQVHIRTWQSTYDGIVPAQHLEGLDLTKSTSKWRERLGTNERGGCHFVAETDDGEIVGFASVGPNQQQDLEFEGELYAIYVLKTHQGKGIGKALFETAVRWLIMNNYRSMLLWVFSENPTRSFYELFGGRIVSEKEVEVGGKVLGETCYGWSELERALGRRG